MEKQYVKSATERGAEDERVGTAIGRAVAAMDDSPSKLATAVNATPGQVSTWLWRGRVSASFAARVSLVSGVPLVDLRPDFFEVPAVASAQDSLAA